MFRLDHDSLLATSHADPAVTTTDQITDWREAPRCRTADPDLFFHPEGERAQARRARLRRAKQVCNQCPVIEQCAAFALDGREGFGIWGGMSEEERITLYVAHGTRPHGRSIHVARWDTAAPTNDPVHSRTPPPSQHNSSI
jgi:WhiB family redox-sensing transcriptional regulator